VRRPATERHELADHLVLAGLPAPIGGGGAGAGAEVAQGQVGGPGLVRDPFAGADEALGEETDIEAETASAGVVALLGRGQQIQQQRREASLLDRPSDVLVARTEPAAAAAV
jgi:hypothetical protein